jgi:phage/plasmid-like protein (TIGR03299 family)
MDDRLAVDRCGAGGHLPRTAISNSLNEQEEEKGIAIMAHEIERLADGTDAFASARTSAWHKLGTVTPDCMTAQEALAAARLADWNVRKLPLQGLEPTLDGLRQVAATDRRMTVRTNPATAKTDYLGVVSEAYEVIQNEECCDLLNQLVDSSGAHFETAGSLKGGRQVFVTMKLPETMTVAGIENEAFETYLAFTTSHDGSSTARIDVTPVRIVCANTQRAALEQSMAHAVIRHSKAADRNIAAARETLGLTWKALERFQTEAEHLIDRTCTDEQFTKLVEQLWPVDDDAGTRALRTAADRAAQLQHLFHHAPTQAEVRGTAWGALQAVIEFIDHYAGKKGDQARAASALFGGGNDLKRRALAVLTAPSG